MKTITIRPLSQHISDRVSKHGKVMKLKASGLDSNGLQSVLVESLNDTFKSPNGWTTWSGWLTDKEIDFSNIDLNDI